MCLAFVHQPHLLTLYLIIKSEVLLPWATFEMGSGCEPAVSKGRPPSGLRLTATIAIEPIKKTRLPDGPRLPTPGFP